MDAIIIALITGGCSVVGVVITTLATSRRTEQRHGHRTGRDRH